MENRLPTVLEDEIGPSEWEKRARINGFVLGGVIFEGQHEEDFVFGLSEGDRHSDPDTFDPGLWPDEPAVSGTFYPQLWSLQTLPQNAAGISSIG